MTRAARRGEDAKVIASINGDGSKEIALADLYVRLDPSSREPITNLLLSGTVEEDVVGNLSRILPINRTLKNLSISVKEIGDEVAGLAEALKRSNTIETLHLFEESVTASEAKARIAANLIADSLLKNLTLCMNLRNAGADIISGALRGKSTTLESLDLKSHGIDETRFNALRTELAERAHPINLVTKTSFAKLDRARMAEVEAAKKKATAVTLPAVAIEPRSGSATAPRTPRGFWNFWK